MKHLCDTCRESISPDTPGEGVSHGKCTYHGLEALARGHVALWWELVWYYAWRIWREEWLHWAAIGGCVTYLALAVAAAIISGCMPIMPHVIHLPARGPIDVIVYPTRREAKRHCAKSGAVEDDVTGAHISPAACILWGTTPPTIIIPRSTPGIIMHEECHASYPGCSACCADIGAD